MSPPTFPPPLRMALIAGAVGLLAVLHYTTGHHDHASAHHLYRRLFYLPILAAAWGWGRRGGLTVAAVVAVVYIPHAFGLFGFHSDPASAVDKVAELLLYGGVGGLVGWFVDRERGTSQRLRRLLADREQTIEQRDQALRDLQSAQAALLQSEQQAAMGFLTAGLAHEIRNPLGAIRGGAELLGDATEEQRARVAELLVRETERLDGVLTRFLRFARHEAGPLERADLADLAEEVVQLVSSEATQRGVEISHLRGSATRKVELDAGGVRQVLLNLVVNAMQAQPDGGHVRLVTGVDDADGAQFVRVEDAGPGVPAERRAEVFHPYVSFRPDGTGLGLAISRRVLAENGGTLTLSDAELGGACFELRLPGGES